MCQSLTGKDLMEEWVQVNKPVARHFTIIVCCTLLSVTLLFIAAFISAFASNYYKGKKRDAFLWVPLWNFAYIYNIILCFSFNLRNDDSSEDETEMKSILPKRKKKNKPKKHSTDSLGPSKSNKQGDIDKYD